MPDADAAWRCPRGCDPCVHFDAALRKDIVDDMLHKYGFDFKEAPQPMIIDSAPIVFTARMMIDPAFPLCGRDSSLKWLVDLLVRTAIACRVHLEDTCLAAYRRLAHEIGKNISSPSRTAERVLLVVRQGGQGWSMARGDGQRGCARARRGACGAGGRGRTLGRAGPLDGHKPIQPAQWLYAGLEPGAQQLSCKQAALRAPAKSPAPHWSRKLRLS